MPGRQVLLYFAWSRPAETGAPLAVIDDRFPAIFELRRLFFPKFESLSGRDDVDLGIGGFLDRTCGRRWSQNTARRRVNCGRRHHRGHQLRLLSN